MDIKELDRIVLIQDFKFGNDIIPKDTLCTCKAFVNEKTVLVQYGYNKEKDQPLFMGVPIVLLRFAEQEEIDKINSIQNFELLSKLLPKKYHIGNCWSVPDGHDDMSKPLYDTGRITNIYLALNELDDKFVITYDDHDFDRYSRSYLDEQGSHVTNNASEFIENRKEITEYKLNNVTPEIGQYENTLNSEKLTLKNKLAHDMIKEITGYKLNNFDPTSEEYANTLNSEMHEQEIITQDNTNISKESEMIEDTSSDLVTININKYTFVLTDDKILLSCSTKLDELDKLAKAILKLKNILT